MHILYILLYMHCYICKGSVEFNNIKFDVDVPIFKSPISIEYEPGFSIKMKVFSHLTTFGVKILSFESQTN